MHRRLLSPRCSVSASTLASSRAAGTRTGCATPDAGAGCVAHRGAATGTGTATATAGAAAVAGWCWCGGAAGPAGAPKALLALLRSAGGDAGVVALPPPASRHACVPIVGLTPLLPPLLARPARVTTPYAAGVAATAAGAALGRAAAAAAPGCREPGKRLSTSKKKTLQDGR